MKKIVITFLATLTLISCDNIGSTKVKNLIDLTPRLEVESVEKVDLSNARRNLFINKKTTLYNLTKSKIIAAPVTIKGIVYTIDSKGYVYAFSLENKKTIWSTDIAKNSQENTFNFGGILYHNGFLFVTNGTRDMVIIDANTGLEIIRKEFPDILRTKPVMIDQKTVLLQTISNQLIAYDVSLSRFIWMHEGGIETISNSNHIAPVIYNNDVLTSYSSGEIVLLDAKTGKEKWLLNLTNITSEITTPSFSPAVIVTNPILEQNYIYFGTSNDKLIKLSLDGTIIWSKDVHDIQSMSLSGDNLFITTNARQVAAVSIINGKVKWTGNLISDKEKIKKRPKPTLFQEPFVSKIGDNITALSVIASNGEMYQFIPDPDGVLPKTPLIKQIKKQVRYQWFSSNGDLYLTTNNEIEKF